MIVGAPCALKCLTVAHSTADFAMVEQCVDRASAMKTRAFATFRGNTTYRRVKSGVLSSVMLPYDGRKLSKWYISGPHAYV
jgi:hypothetical protein